MSPTIDDVDPAAEVERLRTMLDKMPACFLRVANDGTLLAVNDAALTLLGGRGLGDVLDTNFVERLNGTAIRTMWADFVDRVAQSGSASMECQMIEAGSEPRAVVLLGASAPAHADGVSSLVVAVRDVTTARRLEASLQDQRQLRESVQEGLDNATASLQELRARLDEARAERQRLQEALGAEVAHRQQITAAFDQLKNALGSAVSAASVIRQALANEKQQ